MESIILIGDDDFNIIKISEIDFKKSRKSYFSTETRYVVEYDDEHVFYDFSSDIINDYEMSELDEIPFNTFNFVIVSSSNLKKIEEIIIGEEFDGNLYVDNDHGIIATVEEYIKILKSNGCIIN